MRKTVLSFIIVLGLSFSNFLFANTDQEDVVFSSLELVEPVILTVPAGEDPGGATCWVEKWARAEIVGAEGSLVLLRYKSDGLSHKLGYTVYKRVSLNCAPGTLFFLNKVVVQKHQDAHRKETEDFNRKLDLARRLLVEEAARKSK